MLARTALMIALSFGTAGCWPEARIQYVGPAGLYGRGTLMAEPVGLLNGRIRIEDGAEVCDAAFENWNGTVISKPLTCSNGFTGMITLTRSADELAGQGNAVMSDGTTRQIVFGPRPQPGLVQMLVDPQSGHRDQGMATMPPRY